MSTERFRYAEEKKLGRPSSKSYDADDSVSSSSSDDDDDLVQRPSEVWIDASVHPQSRLEGAASAMPYYPYPPQSSYPPGAAYPTHSDAAAYYEAYAAAGYGSTTRQTPQSQQQQQQAYPQYPGGGYMMQGYPPVAYAPQSYYGQAPNNSNYPPPNHQSMATSNAPTSNMVHPLLAGSSRPPTNRAPRVPPPEPFGSSESSPLLGSSTAASQKSNNNRPRSYSGGKPPSPFTAALRKTWAAASQKLPETSSSHAHRRTKSAGPLHLQEAAATAVVQPASLRRARSQSKLAPLPHVGEHRRSRSSLSGGHRRQDSLSSTMGAMSVGSQGSYVTDLRQSSLLAKYDPYLGRPQLHLPQDQVHLIPRSRSDIDDDWAVYHYVDPTEDYEAWFDEESLAAVCPTCQQAPHQRSLPPQYFAIAVPANLHQRLLTEVSDAWWMPCGLYFCGHDHLSQPSIGLALGVVTMVLGGMAVVAWCYRDV